MINFKVIGLLIFHFADLVLRKSVDRRAGTGQQDRRVRGDEELRVAVPPVRLQMLQQVHLTLRGKRRLGLVQKKDPIDREYLVEIRQDGFAVGSLLLDCWPFFIRCFSLDFSQRLSWDQ